MCFFVIINSLYICCNVVTYLDWFGDFIHRARPTVAEACVIEFRSLCLIQWLAACAVCTIHSFALYTTCCLEQVIGCRYFSHGITPCLIDSYDDNYLHT